VEEVLIVGMDDRLHRVDPRMFHKHCERSPQHGGAAKRPELLGLPAAGARAPSGGHHHHCDVRHAEPAPRDFPESLSAFLGRREIMSEFSPFWRVNTFLHRNTCAQRRFV
jgi:hypothetical protein